MTSHLNILKFICITSFLFSTKVYAQSYRPQQDWDYQNWKQDQFKDSSKQNVKQKKARKTRKRYLSSNQSQPRSLVQSKREIRLKDQVYGWESARLQASFGYGQGSITSASSYSGGTSGLRFSLGAHFDMDPFWKASTFIKINYDTLNEDAINAPFGLKNLDVTAIDYGVAQRFLYKASINDFTIAPFIEGQAGRGAIKVAESEQLSTGLASAQTNFNYYKVGAAAGLQFEFDNLLPFFKYEYGFILFDDVVDYEIQQPNAEARSGSSIIENTESLDYTYMTLTAGISYLF